MKCPAKRIAAQLGVMLMLITALSSAQKASPNPSSSSSHSDSMTLWQARRIVAMGNPAWTAWGVERKSFRFTSDSFEFVASRLAVRGEHFNVDLKKLDAVSMRCKSALLNGNNWCTLTNAAGKSLKYDGRGDKGTPWQLYYETWADALRSCSSRCIEAANSFAAAINRLREFAIATESPLHTFTQRAAAWRALPSKPPVPEEVRLQRLLAEEAVKQNNPAEALHRYETGIELYPTWPQGRFNAALIAAELGYFADAVEHMQAYLELVPDAPDAQAARDRIAMWQFKAKETK